MEHFPLEKAEIACPVSNISLLFLYILSELLLIQVALILWFVVFWELNVQWILWLSFYQHGTVLGAWLTAHIFICEKSPDNDHKNSQMALIDVKQRAKAWKAESG